MFVKSIVGYVAMPNSYGFKNRNQFDYNNSLIKSGVDCDVVSFGKLSVDEKHKLFDDYNPVKKDFGSYTLPIHNDSISKFLKTEYSRDDFEKLFNFADENGVFDVNYDKKTKLVQTSLINPKENPLMSKLVWVTDSCNIMPMLKDKIPQACVPVMENMSNYYHKQQRTFDKIINNPDLFELNRGWASTAKNGIGHVFNPNNKVSHKWFARTRLDSMGLYLTTIIDLISSGLNGEKYGYKNVSDISQSTIESIANSTKYLLKINYPYAKDCGPWEEKTFKYAATSDVAIINQAFRDIINFMYVPTENKDILTVRKRLLSAKHGDVFKDEKILREMLKVGEYRIKNTSIEEFPSERYLDGALSFVFKTEKLDDNPLKNAVKIINRLDMLAKNTQKSPEIVRENGILRYINDKYLYLNSDVSGKKSEYNPSRKFPSKSEAQWFMVNNLSTAYGIVARNLISELAKQPKYDKQLRKIIKYALSKQTEFINRGYARITGENSYKANCVKCPPFQVPEAYQAVTDSNGNLKFVPGTHTPLAWAQSTLYEASKLFIDNLDAREQFNL